MNADVLDFVRWHGEGGRDVKTTVRTRPFDVRLSMRTALLHSHGPGTVARTLSLPFGPTATKQYAYSALPSHPQADDKQ